MSRYHSSGINIRDITKCKNSIAKISSNCSDILKLNERLISYYNEYRLPSEIKLQLDELTQLNSLVCSEITKCNHDTVKSIDEFIHSHRKLAPVLTERDVRIEILKETIAKFNENKHEYKRQSIQNMTEWAENVKLKKTYPQTASDMQLFITDLDWGELTFQMTKKFGKTFAALNMANAYSPGGGYLTGCAAQEENMFRRTNCHFSLKSTTSYTTEETDLINAENGEVLLDKKEPRICIRGREYPRAEGIQCTMDNIGYEWLPPKDIFSFYELRAAAIDLRKNEFFGNYEYTEIQKRIRAMLDTLKKHGIRHAVLGAFGCGAFNNPTDIVAKIFEEELNKVKQNFDVIAFGIYHAGYGPQNFQPFKDAFKQWTISTL